MGEGFTAQRSRAWARVAVPSNAALPAQVVPFQWRPSQGGRKNMAKHG